MVMENDTDPECYRCKEKFNTNENYVAAEEHMYHDECFCCDYCFQPFNDGDYFQFQQKLYCKSDFELLHAPICAGCCCILQDTYKIAMGRKWHETCLICSTCRTPLCTAGAGFKQTPDGRTLCSEHYDLELKRGFDKEICQKCFKIVNRNEMLRYKGEAYHAYHFKCNSCQEELTNMSKELAGNLFCLPCHDSQDAIHICEACHKPIEGRRIFALNAYYHVEHFVCATCQRPFLGRLHYEHHGEAYCDKHFQEKLGVECFACGNIITGEHVKALNKPWHDQCFRCAHCDDNLSIKSKFVSIDMRPTCQRCWDQHMPTELKKRLKNARSK